MVKSLLTFRQMFFCRSLCQLIFQAFAVPSLQCREYAIKIFIFILNMFCYYLQYFLYCFRWVSWFWIWIYLSGKHWKIFQSFCFLFFQFLTTQDFALFFFISGSRFSCFSLQSCFSISPADKHFVFYSVLNRGYLISFWVFS